jgi:hypothetical protein
MLLQHLIYLLIFCGEAARSHNATKGTDIQEDMQRFLSNNGFKYVTFIENSTSPSETMVKMVRTIAQAGTSYLQTLTMYEYPKTYTFQFLDVQVFIMDVQNDDIYSFLHAISQAPVRSSVLCTKSAWTDSEETYFKKTLAEFKHDSFFYLAVSSEVMVNWFQVITLKSGYSMTKLKFSPNTFQMIEDYDLKGITVYSISLSQASFIQFEDCDQDGKQCKTYGYLKDYIDVIAQMLNFTYESHKQVDGDWGTVPKSGPFNRSGEWGGIMGELINAKYDMTLSAWWWIRERYDLMSFVIITTNDELLVWTSANLEIDFGLFVRPFSAQSWAAMSSLIAFATIFILMNKYVIPHTEDSNGQKLFFITMWYFFVMLHALYGGAMTMFFTQTIHIKFAGLKDVIHAYPDWKLVFMSGTESKFALSDNPYYANFWARAQASPQDTIFNNIEEGLSLIAKDKNVMYIFKDVLMGHLAANPTHIQSMESIVVEKNIQNCIGFPFNSPLKPLFYKAILKARERGVEGNLIKRWMGANINNYLIIENHELSAGQFILVWVGFMVALTASFVILCAELVIPPMGNIHLAFWGSFHQIL